MDAEAKKPTDHSMARYCELLRKICIDLLTYEIDAEIDSNIKQINQILDATFSYDETPDVLNDDDNEVADHENTKNAEMEEILPLTSPGDRVCDNSGVRNKCVAGLTEASEDTRVSPGYYSTPRRDRTESWNSPLSTSDLIHQDERNDPKEGGASRCLVVSGISKKTTIGDLEEIFGYYGPIEDCDVLLDVKTDRRVAFIVFQEVDFASAAKEALNDTVIDDGDIRVSYFVTDYTKSLHSSNIVPPIRDMEGERRFGVEGQDLLMFTSGDPRPILCHTMVMAAYSPVLCGLLQSLNICEGCISYRSIVLVGEDRDTVAELVRLLHSYPSQRIAPKVENKRMTELMRRLGIAPEHVFDSHQMEDDSDEELEMRNIKTAPFLTHKDSVVQLTRREEPREMSKSMDNPGETENIKTGEMSVSGELKFGGTPITKMKVAELKKELGVRGLSTTGRKQNLVARLNNHVELNEKNPDTDSGNHKVPRQEFVNPFFSLAASSTTRPQFSPNVEATLEKLREVTKLVSSYKNIHEGITTPQMEPRDEGSFNDESAIEDSNPVSLMSVPSPMLACILAARNHGDTESELEELSGTTVMELLKDSSEEEEDRVTILRAEEVESDSTAEEETDHIKIRRLEIKKRRQKREERRARKATKEAAIIRGVGGGRASKRRRDRSNSGEITAAAAAYEG